MPKTATQTLYEVNWTQDERDAHKKAGGYFAGPNQTYPLKTANDVKDAWDLAGHADNPDQIRANIKRWAKENGFASALPDTAKDDEKQEGAATIADSVSRPRKKIATLRVSWLEYNARSLNGRIYPKATCDRIYESAVRKLAANDLPVTVFVSHEAANGNVNTELVGRAVRIWQEGTTFWADLDLADTRTAWDMLALAEGGYLRSESMRVLGVELAHDRNYDLPLVVVQEGVEPDLLGIDLTTRPGLQDTARIQQVLYESAALPFFYSEAFAVDAVQIMAKEANMSIPLFIQLLTGMQEGMTPDRAAHHRIHDHLAGVLDDAVGPMHGSESARLKAAVVLDEAGRAIAKKHAARLAMAHDEAAQACGMECMGAYNSTVGIPLDPDQDGDTDAMLVIPDDDSDHESAKNKKGKNMTEAEMLAALAAKGYTVTAPKTVEEQLADLRAELATMKAARVTTEGASQRQTEVAPSTMSEQADYQPEQLYREGDYLHGPLHPRNWKALADPRVPWPQDVDPAYALKELAPFLAYRLNEEEAHARGREVSAYIKEYEQV